MGSKSKSRAKNKAKRTGVPKPADAASSAAAAAAGNVVEHAPVEPAALGVPTAPPVGPITSSSADAAETGDQASDLSGPPKNGEVQPEPTEPVIDSVVGSEERAASQLSAAGLDSGVSQAPSSGATEEIRGERSAVSNGEPAQNADPAEPSSETTSSLPAETTSSFDVAPTASAADADESKIGSELEEKNVSAVDAGEATASSPARMTDSEAAEPTPQPLSIAASSAGVPSDTVYTAVSEPVSPRSEAPAKKESSPRLSTANFNDPKEDEFFRSISEAGKEAKRVAGTMDQAKIISKKHIEEELAHGHIHISDEESDSPFEASHSVSSTTSKPFGTEEDEFYKQTERAAQPPLPRAEEPASEVGGELGNGTSLAETVEPTISVNHAAPSVVSSDTALGEDVQNDAFQNDAVQSDAIPNDDLKHTDSINSQNGLSGQNGLAPENGSPAEEDDFYRSLSAAGREAQRSRQNLSTGSESASVRSSPMLCDDVEQDQNAAFDEMVSDVGMRDAENEEESRAAEPEKPEFREGMFDDEPETDPTREESEAAIEQINADTLAQQQALAEQASEQLLGDSLAPDQVPEGELDAAPDNEDDPFYGALSVSGQTDPAEQTGPAEQEELLSGTRPSSAAPEEDDFFRALTSTAPPRDRMNKIHIESEDEDGTDALAIDRVNGGSTSSVGSSSIGGNKLIVNDDDFYASLNGELAAPAVPAAPASNPEPKILNLDLDDDFLEEDDDENGVQLPHGTVLNPSPLPQTVPAESTLSFLESDDDLLPDDEINASQNEVSEPEPQPVPKKPSFTEFHTEKRGFDLPLEMLPQPVRRHAPQRVSSRTGTPQGSVSAPSGPPPTGFPPAPGARATPLSPPAARTVAPPPLQQQQRAAPPGRVPSRTQSASGSGSKYAPASPVGADPRVPPQANPLTPQHNMFLTEGPSQPGAPQPRPFAAASAPPGAAPRPVVPPPARNSNPDPYGFPGLVSAPPKARRASSRSSAGSARVPSGPAPPRSAALPPARAQYATPASPYGAFVPAPGPPMHQPHMHQPPMHQGYSPSAGPGTGPVPGAGTAGSLNVSPRTTVPPSAFGQPGAPAAAAYAPITPGPGAPQYDQFGPSLSPAQLVGPAPIATDPRSRYTPSPLNAPTLAVPEFPRGDTAEEQLLKRQRPLFAWSPHSWVHIAPETKLGASGAIVHTGDLKSLAILPAASMAKFPFPVLNSKGAIKSKKKELDKWIDERSLAIGGGPGALLYAVFKQLLGTDDKRESGVREVLKAYSVLAAGSPASSAETIVRTAPIQDFLSMLRDGDRVGAMQAALDTKNYGHALVIAHALGGDHWKLALNDFVAEEVRQQDPQLALIYRALGSSDAPSGVEALGELKPLGQTSLIDFARLDANLERWADSAAALYGGGVAAHAALAELGSLLVDRGRAEEGHTCFVLAGVAPGSLRQFSLPLVSASGVPSFDSFALAEVYEYLLGRIVRELVPYKVDFAGLLVDAGYIAEAQKTAENTAALVKAVKGTPKLADQAARMVMRCSASAPAQGTWLQRKLSRPNLEKTWVSSFNRFVSGDDVDAEPQRPQSASGMPLVPEVSELLPPQRGSYTPGPYQNGHGSSSPGQPGFLGAPGSAGAVVAANSAGLEMPPIRTPSRPATIGEVNEEYGAYDPESSFSSQPQHLPSAYPGQQPAYQSPLSRSGRPEAQLDQFGSNAALNGGAYAPSPAGHEAYGPRPPSQGAFAQGSYGPGGALPSQFQPSGAYDPQESPYGGESAPQAQYVPNQYAASPYAAQDTVPNQYAPEQAAPHQYAPSQYAPSQYAPSQYAPDQPAPGQYAPNQYAPNQYAPNQYAPNQYAPVRPGSNQPQNQAAPVQAAPAVQRAPNQHAPSRYAPSRYAPETSGPSVPAQPAVSNPPEPAAYSGPQGQPQDDSPGIEAPANESQPEPKREESTKDEKAKDDSKGEQPRKKGWFGWLKKDDSNKPIPVKLGSDAKLIYDEELKRWIKEGDPRPEPLKGPAPPPKAKSVVAPAGSPAPAAGGPGLPAGPPAGVAPGPALSPAPAALSPAPAGAPAGAPTGPGPSTNGAAPGPPAKSPPAAAAPRASSGGIDDILAAASSAPAGRKKRAARNRYAPVTGSGLPEGMAP